METILKDKQSVSATIAVSVDRETVDATFRRVIESYAKHVKVPGFRPGKAPRGVVIKRVGQEVVTKEAREAIIESSSTRAILEHELNAVHVRVDGGDPREGESFVYDLHVEMFPQFEIPATSSIVIDTPIEPVGDEQIQQTIENLRREHATQVPVDRPIDANDVVRIETVGEDDERREGTSMPIDMSTTNAGIVDQLLGKSIGDVFDLQLESPRRQERAAPEEQVSSTRIYVADVKAKELPETDDAFAATMGFESWSDVLVAIRNTLEVQAKDQAREAQREEFVEKLMAGTEVDLPNHFVNRRKGDLLESLARDLRRQGMEMDAYLSKLDAEGKRDEFDAELQASAERNAKRDLVLGRLLEVHPAEVSDDEFDEAVRYMARQEDKDVAAFRSERGQDWLDYYRFLLRRDKALRSTVEMLVGDEATEAATDASHDGTDAVEGDTTEDAPTATSDDAEQREV